jgi:hypothetical protein
MKIVKLINNFSDGSGKRREWEQVLGKQILDATLQEQRISLRHGISSNIGAIQNVFGMLGWNCFDFGRFGVDNTSPEPTIFLGHFKCFFLL